MNRLILVDDNPRDRVFLREVLTEYGPLVTANGREALTACAGDDAPWLVTDIQMPELNGVELARRIWREKPAARIVFWSQHDDETYVRTLSKLIPAETVYGYVLKTKPAQTLARAAQAVFGECQCWIDPDIRPVQARTQRAGDALSDAEYDVLMDIALGLTDHAIAERRYLSRRGVQNRLQSLYNKLGANLEVASADGEHEQVNVRLRAVALALQRGLLNAFELKAEEKRLTDWLARR